MDYSKFKNWKNFHATEMQDLAFARPDNIFLFTRFAGKLPFEFNSRQVLFAESIEEAIGYIRHIFLYDIFNDTTDDLELDPKSLVDERQKDAISLLNYWFRLGKISTGDNRNQAFKEFCDEFNCEFNKREDIEYEIRIFNCADELRKFLISNFSEIDESDKKRLLNICSGDLFAGKLLKDFLDILFR